MPVMRSKQRGVGGTTSRWLAFCGVTCAIAIGLAAFSFAEWRHTEILDRARITAIEGQFSYEFPRTFFRAAIFGRHADHDSSPSASNLVLFENGKRLGAPHSLPDEIRMGGGCYRHWQVGAWARRDVLFFSTSDNSDPRTNGRAYSVEYNVEPGRITRSLVAALCVISVLGLYRAAVNDPTVHGAKVRMLMAGTGNLLAQGHPWTLVVLVAAGYVIAYYALWMPLVPMLTWDSRTYLTGSLLVPLGYWCFASLVSWFSGSLGGLPAAQISVWAGSVVVLYFTLSKITRFRFVAALVSVSVLLLGTVTKFAMFALTETIFASVLVLHVAAVLATLDSPTRLRFLLVGVTAFLAAFIRPAGYFVALCTLALFLMLPRSRRSILFFCVLPMVSFYLVAGAVSYAYRGVGTQALLGLALFPHVGHLFKAEYVPHPAAKAVEDSLAAYRAEILSKRNGQDRARFELENFNRASDAVQTALQDFGFRSEEELNGCFQTFAFATLRRRPLDYAAHVADHVTFAWTDMAFYPINTAEWLRQHYAAFEEQHNALVSTVRERFAVPPYRFTELLTGTRSLALGSAAIDYVPNFLASIPRLGPFMGIVSAFFVVAALFQKLRTPRLCALAYIGALMHGAVFLVAGTTAVIPRYTDPLAPVAIILLALFFDCALAWCWRSVSRWIGQPTKLAASGGS